METATAPPQRHRDHDHEPMPTSGRALDLVALSATLHCLTGCAIGEVTGMVIGTALGFSTLGTIALAVALAFLFGYALTSVPLLRAGLAFSTVVPIALAADTFSIATMEIVDNLIMVAVPGAMEAGVGNLLFWGALSVALVIAGVVAYPVNRRLIRRGKGHAVLHETGIHGGPPTRVVAVVFAALAIFGTTVLIAEAVGGGSAGHGEPAGGGHARSAGEPAVEATAPVRGLSASEGGLRIELDRSELPRGRAAELSFRIVGQDGDAVRDFEVEHEKRMHFIVTRRDLTGFQHLHPEQDGDGAWITSIELGEAGSYRVFADFKTGGQNRTLAADLTVDGPARSEPLPPAEPVADAGDGYEVRLEGAPARAGSEAELAFAVTRGGREAAVDDYLGAKGHLVALRDGDLGYLHVHPLAGEDRDDGHAGGPVAFATEFPTAGRYRLFLQFRHAGRVRTAAFTADVGA